MYGVWRTCRHYSEQGLQPSAVSKSLPALREWARLNLRPSASKRPFFAEKVGSGTDWTDAKWTVTGFFYANDEIRIDRVDPELYTTHRQGKTVFSNAAYNDPTEGDWATLTVDIDK